MSQLREYDVDGNVSLHWTNPATSFAKVIVRYRRGATAPSGMHDGKAAHLAHAKSDSTTMRHLATGARYSVAVWTLAAGGAHSFRRTAHFAIAKPGGPKGTLSGAVRDSGGDPLQEAVVLAYSYYGTVMYRTRTDVQGHYSLSVPSGWYGLTVDGRNATGGANDATGYVSTGRQEFVRPRHAALHDFLLRPGGVIEGRVVDAQGRPLAGVAPEVLHAPAYVGFEAFFDIFDDVEGTAPASGSKGRFSLRGVPQQALIICFNTSRMPITGGESATYAARCLQRPTSVSPGTVETVADQTLTAMATGSVSGSVTDRKGDGVPSASLTLKAANGSGPRATTSTDGSGRYSVAGLAPGRYRICVTVDEFTGQPRSARTGVRSRCKPRTIRVRVAQASTASVVLPPGAAMEGEVTGPNGRPVRFANLYLRRPHFDTRFAGYTDTTGHYVVRGIPPGPWRVCFDTTAAPVPGVPTGARSGCIHQHHAIRLSRGRIRTGVNAQLKPAAALVVTTVDANGVPMTGSQVSASQEDAAEFEVLFTNSHGRAVLRGLTPGINNVCVEVDVDGGPGSERCSDHTVGKAGHLTRLHFRYRARASLSVDVRDSEGRRISGVDAAVLKRCTFGFLCRKQPLFNPTQRVQVAASGATNAAGRYRVAGLREGNYAVCLFGYWAATSAGAPDDGYADTCSGHAFDISVAAGKVTNIRLTLDDGGAVTGTVTDTSGNPLQNARVLVMGAAAADYRPDFYVYMEQDENPRRSLLTDASGAFAIRSVQPGNQQVCVQPANARGGTSTTGYLAQCLPATVTVTADGTTSGIHVEVDAAAGLAGTVTSDDGSPLRRVDVALFRHDRVVAQKLTKADGTYSYKGLNAQSFVVCFVTQKFHSECYDNVRYKHWSYEPPPSAATKVSVTNGILTTIDASLTPKS